MWFYTKSALEEKKYGATIENWIWTIRWYYYIYTYIHTYKQKHLGVYILLCCMVQQNNNSPYRKEFDWPSSLELQKYVLNTWNFLFGNASFLSRMYLPLLFTVVPMDHIWEFILARWQRVGPSIGYTNNMIQDGRWWFQKDQLYDYRAGPLGHLVCAKTLRRWAG